MVKQSAQEIVDAVQALPGGTRILVLAPVVRGRKGTYQAVFEEVRKAGFVRARVDGTVFNLDEEINLDRYKIHTIEAVVDRLVISAAEKGEDAASRHHPPDRLDRDRPQVRGRLPDRPGRWLEKPDDNHDLHFSEHLACPEHGISIPEIEPRTFSFNTPHGACPDCQGLGNKLEIDPDRVVDPERSLSDGALVAMEWSNAREEAGYYWQLLDATAQHFHIDTE